MRGRKPRTISDLPPPRVCRFAGGEIEHSCVRNRAFQSLLDFGSLLENEARIKEKRDGDRASSGFKRFREWNLLRMIRIAKYKLARKWKMENCAFNERSLAKWQLMGVRLASRAGFSAESENTCEREREAAPPASALADRSPTCRALIVIDHSPRAEFSVKVPARKAASRAKRGLEFYRSSESRAFPIG